MTRKKTHSEFIEEMKLKRPDITVLGVYINNATKIEFQHNCEYQYRWLCAPHHILAQKKCPKCSLIERSKGIAKTTKKFIDEIKLINPEITVIGEYINCKTKIKVMHICGYKWGATPNSLLQGTYCPKCSFKKLTKTTEQFIEELKFVNPELTVLGEYIGALQKIKVKHTCGYKWDSRPSDLLRGRSCPKCFRLFKKTTEQFIEELKIITPEITVIGEYIAAKSKIKVKHTCGYEWSAAPTHLLAGHSCPSCNESKGERIISQLLIKNNIDYISQFNLVRNPKTNYWLISDFAVLDKERNPILIIEYDGEQHFKPVKHFGGDEGLKSVQYRDSLKDNYCKQNNIPFIRFSYKQSENDIEDLLLKQLQIIKLI